MLLMPSPAALTALTQAWYCRDGCRSDRCMLVLSLLTLYPVKEARGQRYTLLLKVWGLFCSPRLHLFQWYSNGGPVEMVKGPSKMMSRSPDGTYTYLYWAILPFQQFKVSSVSKQRSCSHQKRPGSFLSALYPLIFLSRAKLASFKLFPFRARCFSLPIKTLKLQMTRLF